MVKEINPSETSRAYAYNMWMKAPMPMVTFFKTLDVSRLLRFSRRRKMKFNMLMCYCIGKAASQIEEFRTLPVGDRLLRYDTLAVNTIVLNRQGEVSSCDIPFSTDLYAFNADYLQLTRQVADHVRTMTCLKTVWSLALLLWRGLILTELWECTAASSIIRF